MDALTNKTKELAATAGEYVGRAEHKIGELASATAESAGRLKNQAQEWASTAADKTGAALQSGGHELTRFIRRHPGTTLLFGFGIGFLLGRRLRL